MLDTRSLNRATLARQLLLRRARMTVPDALEHFVGLQAQAPAPPYVGLWTRLEGFEPEELSRGIEDRSVVRIALMRSTIHLVTARDAIALRPIVQPVLDRQVAGSYGRQLDGLDPAALVAAARAALDGGPLTFAALGERLAERWPDRDPRALANAARAWLPLVQVPPRGLWGRSGAAAHLPADAWLGRLEDTGANDGLEALVVRYLAAFGPATVMDVQKWSGLTRLREVIERLRPRLVWFRDEDGRDLFDLPDAPRPDPDTPAPPRFLPEFDNLLLSHADRTRVIGPEHWSRVMRGGMILGSVLLDGTVAGTWKLDRKRDRATLRVSLFGSRPGNAQALEEEAGRMLVFAAEGAEHEVRIAAG